MAKSNPTKLVELWKPVPIPEFIEDYEISSLGRVRRLRNMPPSLAGRILKPHKIPKGYCQVRLCSPVDRRMLLIHRLVMLAFVGPVPERMQVNHLNGNKEDNCLENLEYTTASANVRHAFAIGLKNQQGENNQSSTITENDVRQIRSLYASGWTLASLGKRFQMTKQGISLIVKRKNWSHIK